jgi:phosphopantetheine adenylyltransferase
MSEDETRAALNSGNLWIRALQLPRPRRAGAHAVDRLIVAILRNESKQPLFSVDERISMIREVLGDRYPNVELDCFNAFLVDFAAEKA